MELPGMAREGQSSKNFPLLHLPGCQNEFDNLVSLNWSLKQQLKEELKVERRGMENLFLKNSPSY